MLMIAHLVPYVAFGAAAALVGWVAFDLAMARLRKIKPQAPAAEDSGRALAGPPAPLSARFAPRPQPAPPASVAFTPEAAASAPLVRLSDRIEAQPDMPFNFAQDLDQPELEPEPEPADEETVLSPEANFEDEPESSDSEQEPVLYNDPIVRRDESVRVYDSSVAASGRHSK
jgi:hypothetical protein